MFTICKEYISSELNCSIADLHKEGTVFAANDLKPYPFLQVSTMGQATFVSVSSALLPKISSLLQRKTKDEVFECPFVYGQSLFYLPDLAAIKRPSLPSGFDYGLLEGKELYDLRGLVGFDNSLGFDPDGSTSTCIVLYARMGKEIIALAGASRESEHMWQLGIDVTLPYRNNGLAAALISTLACIILDKGIVPFYCASVTNIASQRVAHRSHFLPAWVSTYGTILDGSSSYF